MDLSHSGKVFTLTLIFFFYKIVKYNLKARFPGFFDSWISAKTGFSSSLGTNLLVLGRGCLFR